MSDTTENSVSQPSTDASCATKKCCFKRPIPLALLSTAVIAFGGYGVMWNKQANQLKAEVEKHLAAWNDPAQTGLAKEDFSLTYSKISTAGFPAEVAIRIEQPKLHYTGKAFKQLMDTLAAKSAAGNELAQASLSAYPMVANWSEDAQSAGAIYIGGNYFTQTVKARVEGITSGTSRIGDKTLPWETQAAKNPLSCEVKFAPKLGLSILKGNLFTALGSPEATYENIKHVACASDPLTLVATDTKEKLANSAGTKFGLYKNDEADASIINVDVVANVKDTEFQPRLNEYYKEIGTAFAAAGSVDAAFIGVKQASMQGKQNIDINVHYRAPKDMANAATGNVDVAFKSFKIDNGAMSLDWPFKLHIAHTAEESVFNVDGEMRLKITKAYDDALAASLKGLPALLAGKDNPLAHGLVEAEKNAGGREKLENALANIAPRASELGTIRLLTKAEFKGSNPKEGLAPIGAFKADVVEVMTDKYGLQLSGTALLDSVKVDLNVKCVACDDMVDNTVGYLVSVQDVMVWMDPSIKNNTLDSTTPSKLKKFIASISKADAQVPTTRVVTVKDNGKGDIRISDKGMLDVMMAWMQSFMAGADVTKEIEKQGVMNPDFGTHGAKLPEGYTDDVADVDPLTGQPVLPQEEASKPAASPAPVTTDGEADAPAMGEPTAQDLEAEAKKAFEAHSKP